MFSSVAEAVDLCLFDAAGNEERRPLEQVEGYVWTGRVEGAGHGRATAIASTAPAPCNPAKLLLDPYARGIEGEVTWDPAVTAQDTATPRRSSRARWSRPRRSTGATTAIPGTPLADSVMYELHVKGFTKLHPGVPEELRGTYAGLAHPAAIEHLLELGVTAVELLPVHTFVSDRRADRARAAQLLGLPVDRLLRAPRGLRGGRRGAGVPRDGEARSTRRGSRSSSTSSSTTRPRAAATARRCASGAWTRPRTTACRTSTAATSTTPGCGNTLDADRPQGLRLVMDALRHWCEEMHVDGFRFDLAAALGRGDNGFDPFTAFL